MHHLRNFRIAFILLGISLTLRSMPSVAESTVPIPDVPPPWAYPVDPPNAVAPKDDGTLRHVPDSPLTMTWSEVSGGFVSPDWHPQDHPALPEVVKHGRKPDVMACGYCHRAEGTGGPENASVAGLPVTYILQQVADFKSGARSTALPTRAPQAHMISTVKAATDAEIAAAAAYFSTLKPKKVVRVVETDMAPQTQVHGWHLVDFKTGKEPIGERVIEVPKDLEQFVSRDSHAQFIAYVPVGSIEKGKALATTVGNGHTVQCIVCHGPDLRGLGPIPGIAGRSPSYIVRQLYDFQHGARAGIWSALMKPTVEKLSTEDMVDLAAYAGSLTP